MRFCLLAASAPNQILSGCLLLLPVALPFDHHCCPATTAVFAAPPAANHHRMIPDANPDGTVTRHDTTPTAPGSRKRKTNIGRLAATVTVAESKPRPVSGREAVRWRTGIGCAHATNVRMLDSPAGGAIPSNREKSAACCPRQAAVRS